jgi:nicotinate-nucleotide--dimethylbenzimidazole phosphoribosyltransferase
MPAELMQAHPTLPAELDPAPPELGRLGPWLHDLARAQGSWPPSLPRQVGSATPAQGWDAGVAEGDRLVDEGADLVVVRGGGPRGPALALLAVLLRLDPAAAVGTANTPDWADLIGEVRRGLTAAKAFVGQPSGIVTAVGAAQVAGWAGVLAQCAVRRTPVLLSAAPDVVAAAVLAHRVAFGTGSWLLLASTGSAGAVATGLTDLGRVPLLDLQLPGPESADLALAMLPAAIALAADLLARPAGQISSLPVNPAVDG